MSALDLTGLGAAEVGRLIAAGKADPVEVAEDYFARIEACEDQSIYLCVTPARARRDRPEIPVISGARSRQCNIVGFYTVNGNPDWFKYSFFRF